MTENDGSPTVPVFKICAVIRLSTLGYIKEPSRVRVPRELRHSYDGILVVFGWNKEGTNVRNT